MCIKQFLLTIAALLPGLHALGQNGQWISYPASIDGRAASVLVDAALGDNADANKFEYLLITGPMLKYRITGLPDSTELKAMEDALDATGTYLKAITPWLLAGTVTYSGRRLNYYYVRDTNGVRGAIQRLYRKNFAEYIPVIALKREPALLTWEKYLMPSDSQLNTLVNQQILFQLHEQGIDLKKEATIKFAACFPTPTDAQQFRQQLDTVASISFKEQRSIKNAGLPVCVYYIAKLIPKSTEINILTLLMRHTAVMNKGRFAGWSLQPVD